MHRYSPIIMGSEQDHTKVYDKERHCFNCNKYYNEECLARVTVHGSFEFKSDYPAERQRVYIGRVIGSVCGNYTLKGKEWDR